MFGFEFSFFSCSTRSGSNGFPIWILDPTMFSQAIKTNNHPKRWKNENKIKITTCQII
jgi:V8-like Glu-specific endopeptidase